MRVVIDADSSRVVLAPGVTQEVAGLYFKRTSVATLEVQFSRGLEIIELPEDASGEFGIKVAGKYDSTPLAGALAWVKSGTGADTVYTFPFTLISVALDALFMVDGNINNDVASIDFMGEISWRYDSRDRKSQTLTVNVKNNVIRDDDEVPSMVLGARVPAGGTEGQVLAKASDDNFDTEWVNRARFFVDLEDVPNTYAAHAGQLVAVKEDESGLEFIEPGATNFIDLGDVPHDYSGQAGMGIRVNEDEDGMEFVELFDGSFDNLTDLPTTLLGYGITDAQAHSTELDALAALTGTAYGRLLITRSDAAAVRSYIGAGTSSFTGSFVDLSEIPTTLAGYGIVDAQPLDPDLTAISSVSTDAFGIALLTKTSAAAVRSYIGAGTSSFSGAFADLSGLPTTLTGYGITDAQPLDPDLTAIAALTTTSFGRSFLTVADAAGGRSLIGLGTAALADTGSSSGNVPVLDVTGKIPTSLLPDSVLGNLKYQNSWNATTNTPTIPAAAAGNKGHYYVVATAGSTSIDGITDWKVGDWLISNGSTWDKIDNTDLVTSVAGRVGAVTLTSSDLTDSSTVGRAIVGLANPGAITFIRMNADNSITARSAGNFKADLSLDNVENTALSTWIGSTNITTLGTIGTGTWQGTAIATSYIANSAVTYAKIQDVSATSRLLGRMTAGAGVTEELTITQAIDFVTGTPARGDILFRNASFWSRLAAGTSGQFLKTLGSSANPIWADAAGIIITGAFAKSANFTVTTAERGSAYFVTTGASTITATLPSAGSAGSGWHILLLKADAGAGVIASSPAVTSPSGILAAMLQRDIVLVFSDGANYYAANLPATSFSTWAGSANLTTLGTIASGTWNGSVVAGQYGGTGVANTGKTITLGGNLVTSGAFAVTLTASATTNVTLPTTGTLLTAAGAVTSLTGTANEIDASASVGAVTLSLPTAMTMTGKTMTGGIYQTFVATQAVNGNSIFVGKRITDASPSGDFLALLNTSNGVIFNVSVTGVLSSNASATFYSTVTSDRTGVAANTSIDGIILQNTDAASSGNQMYSPRTRWTGQGWKTAATAATRALDFIAEIKPTQATTEPLNRLVFSGQVNSGGYIPVANFLLDCNSGATNEVCEIGVTNTNATGTASGAIFRATASTAHIQFAVWGAGRTDTRFGVTIANYAEVISVAGSGIIFGSYNNVPVIFGTNALGRMKLSAAGGLNIGGTGDPGVGNLALSAGKMTTYNGVATAGWGVPAIQAAGRFAAQTAAKATVATYTVGAADGSFEISANILVTTSTTHNFTVTCAYTDEGNTARTLTLGFTQLTGSTFISAITNVTGVGPYESPVYHLRCKAGTAITIATTGTFTLVTYNCEGIIKQTA